MLQWNLKSSRDVYKEVTTAITMVMEYLQKEEANPVAEKCLEAFQYHTEHKGTSFSS